MAININNQINEEEDKETLVAELPSISEKEQTQTIMDNAPLPEEENNEVKKFTHYRKLNKEQKSIADDEYKSWYSLSKDDPSRSFKKEQWYLKYYGMNLKELEEYNNKYSGFYPGSNNLVGNLQNTFKGLSMPGISLMDFGFDVVGNVPGGNLIDNFWDKKTADIYDEHATKLRRILSIVIPSIWAGGKVTQGLRVSGLQNAPRLQQAATAVGAYGAAEAAIIGLSDQGYEDTITQSMAETFPGVFGPEGTLPIPGWARTKDSDSPEVRKYKNMLENTVFSFAGTLLGAWIDISKGGRGLSWFEPLDNTAAAYKTRELSKASDPDKLIRIQEINNALSTQNLSRKVQTQLEDELIALKDSLGGIDTFEEALRQSEVSSAREVDEAAKGKISRGEVDGQSFDPDLTPVTDKTKRAIPPGNVARNQADVAAIKAGQATGDPAPIITEAMRNKALMVGSTSRDAVLGVAEQARDLGRFDALVNGFRFTKKNMDALAWDTYTSIIAADNMDDLRALFLDYKDTKTLLAGKLKVEYINEEQARGAAFAMRDLVDRFLGRDIAMNSARVMDTMGREAATLAEAVQDLKPFMDDQKGMDLVIDKLQFLMDEYALNKYISGWSLKNKDWADAIPPADFETTIKTLTSEFKTAENRIHAANLKLTKELKRLATENPMAMRPLMDAFAYTKGDVDSLAKLLKWAGSEIDPRGMIVSPNPREMNLFARNAFAVVFNNVLSGLSPFVAGLDVTSKLTLRPITQLTGSALKIPFKGVEQFQRTMYFNGAMFETNRRALTDAWTMIKRAHKDPELMLNAYRKDLKFKKVDAAKWAIMDQMREVWEAEGNTGKIALLNTVEWLRDLSQAPWNRYGMSALTGPDAFAWTHVAHQLARIRAYEDVFTEFGFADWKKILLAEKKYAKEFFDANGLIKDSALKKIAGEITLNLDDKLASWINQGTTAVPISKHLLMFPRTQSNDIKTALSWTPLQSIPGINKYSKTIWAKNPDEIAAALAEHGISMKDPGAQFTFENLQSEYLGRIAFSLGLTKLLWNFAMDGNIRGGGHYNADRRAKERDEMGYEPYTIRIGGKWVPYGGIPGLKYALGVVGDMSYYAADIEQPFIEDWHRKLAWSISAGFLQNTPIQSIEPLLAAVNGELGQWNRLISKTALSYVPNSSALGVLSNAISSTQKDIQGEIHEYMMNRLPFANLLLDDRWDLWTNKKVNDINHPFLKIINATTRINLSDGNEPWREWLRQTGWNGYQRIKKDTTGSYEYSPAERQFILREISRMNLHTKLIPLMKNKALNKQLGQVRFHRASGDDDNERVEINANLLPVIKKIDKIVSDAHKIAERRLIEQRPDIANIILYQRAANEAMKRGDVTGATKLQQKEQDTRTLLNMAK